jgi:hypothetical protein
MFRSVDTDNSGFIDYSEFVVAAMNEKQLLTNEKLQAAFKMFDKVFKYLPFNFILGRKWFNFLKRNQGNPWFRKDHE